MKASLLALLRPRSYTFSFVTIALLTAAVLLGLRLRANGQASTYTSAAPGKNDAYHHYDWQHGEYPPGTIKGEAVDEAKGGFTFRGTPVAPRTPKCFPAEPRDLFWQMDMVFSETAGKLVPLDFDEDKDGEVGDKPNPEFNGRDPLGDPADRDGIRGRNTWLLWGGGN
jgi:hypothetical protein